MAKMCLQGKCMVCQNLHWQLCVVTSKIRSDDEHWNWCSSSEEQKHSTTFNHYHVEQRRLACTWCIDNSHFISELKLLCDKSHSICCEKWGMLFRHWINKHAEHSSSPVPSVVPLISQSWQHSKERVKKSGQTAVPTCKWELHVKY